MNLKDLKRQHTEHVAGYTITNDTVLVPAMELGEAIMRLQAAGRRTEALTVHTKPASYTLHLGPKRDLSD